MIFRQNIFAEIVNINHYHHSNILSIYLNHKKYWRLIIKLFGVTKDSIFI